MSAAALALLIAGPALADGYYGGSVKDVEPPKPEREFSWSVNGGIMSDYVFRGQSQNNEDPSWFVGADIGYGIFYAGVWAAEVDQFFTASDAEVDVYAGITPTLGPVTFDLGVIYYGYVNQTAAVNVDYWEFKGGASIALLDDKLTLGVTYFYSPDYTFETGESHTVEGKAAYSLPKFWVFEPEVSALIGYNDVERAASGEYVYWNAGITLAVEALSLDFRYWDTDINDGIVVGPTGNELADERFVFTAKVALP